MDVFSSCAVQVAGICFELLNRKERYDIPSVFE